MNMAVIQRHAILHAKAAGDLGEVAGRARRAFDKTGYSQGIALTYKPELVEAEVLRGYESELGRQGVETRVIEWKGHNSGTLFYSAFEMCKGAEGRIIANFDDFPVDDEGVSDAFYFMKDKLQKGCPVVIGARERVMLSADKRLNSRRQIHEMLMATLYPEVDFHNPFGVDTSAVPEAYKLYGDRASGCYGISCVNPLMKETIRKIKEVRQIANMETYFCPEYLLFLLAAKQTQLQLVYVQVPSSNRGSGRSGDEVNRMISHDSAQLFRTEVWQKLKKHISKPETVARISNFYPREEVLFVRDLMLSG